MDNTDQLNTIQMQHSVRLWNKSVVKILSFEFFWFNNYFTGIMVDAFSEWFLFLHLHEIVEGLYFYFSLSVCLYVCVIVCVCVCVCVSVNKIPAERMHQFGCGFCLIVAYCTGSDPIEIGDQGHCDRKWILKSWKKFAKNSSINIFENKSFYLKEHFIAVIMIPNTSIL